MIILLAVVGAGGGERAEGQPVGHVHDRATMPIAIFMGLYLRYLAARQGAGVLRRIGFVLVMASIFGGQCGGAVADAGADCSRFTGVTLAIADHSLWIPAPARCRSGCCSRRAIT